jgi:hypothetical protein
MTNTHPREGYVAELWLGQGAVVGTGRVCVLVEIVECYYASGNFSGYHYLPHDLVNDRSMEVKTIGPMQLDQARAFAQRHTMPFEVAATWRRLR